MAIDIGADIDRFRPVNGIADDSQNMRIIEGRIGLMTGLKIEDFTGAAVPAAAGTEYFTAAEPADENLLVWLWNIKKFAVHFFFFQYKAGRNSFRDGVAGIDAPNALELIITPAERTGCPHQPGKRLTVVSRVEGNETVTRIIAQPLFRG